MDASEYAPLAIVTSHEGKMKLSVYREGMSPVKIDINKDRALLLLQQIASGLSSLGSLPQPKYEGLVGRDVFTPYTGPSDAVPWGLQGLIDSTDDEE